MMVRTNKPINYLMEVRSQKHPSRSISAVKAAINEWKKATDMIQSDEKRLRLTSSDIYKMLRELGEGRRFLERS